MMKPSRTLPLLCALLLLCACSSATQESSSSEESYVYDPYAESWEITPYMEWYPRPEAEPAGQTADWEIWGKTVDTDSFDSIAITNDGSVWTWGYNEQYQAGTGYNSFQTKPVKVLEDAVTVEMGSHHTAVIRTDGSLWVWGGNGLGQSGTGSEELAMIYPQKTMDNIAMICPQANTVVVIDKDQKLWEWGVNDLGGYFGNLTGDARVVEPSYISTPQKKLDRVLTAVSVDARVTALRSDGGLWCWGYNSRGESGSIPKVADSTYVDYVLEPTQILKDIIWADVGGMSTGYAIDRNRKVWIWGNFSYSKRGDSEKFEGGTYYVPQLGFEDFKGIYDGFNHLLALKEDGSLWSWGNNQYGQLGNGSFEKTPWPPFKVMDNVRAVSTNNTDFSFAITKDDVLWGWGYNKYGQLGIGNNEHQSSPVKVMEGVNSVYQDDKGYTLVLKQDGTLWTFGSNYVGQLGDGTREERNAPVKILDDVRLPQPEPDWESRIWPEETSSTAETTE